ncbi:hydroxyisourate hydrolase [Cohnella sp. REN36]|uniref:hydroxyisourate hydrolase n=1 Tax=Cohnella sp. REN36 TaxID=2887347 RepID=UPI001D142DC1|nr:hydroxyisourate hydrolase [Cohnella sp. REN36]MCC3372684.1 hydroxyisourate hydrolase [Cohnella sp. REN36]
MKGGLTTHVLDLSRGVPAAGVKVRMWRLREDGTPGQLLGEAETNADGRLGQPLIGEGGLERGLYELVFGVGDYFRGLTAGEETFLETVPVRFRVPDPDAHYHIPLLVAPGGYSTYRGS